MNSYVDLTALRRLLHASLGDDGPAPTAPSGPAAFDATGVDRPVLRADRFTGCPVAAVGGAVIPTEVRVVRGRTVGVPARAWEELADLDRDGRWFRLEMLGRFPRYAAVQALAGWIPRLLQRYRYDPYAPPGFEFVRQGLAWLRFLFRPGAVGSRRPAPRGRDRQGGGAG